MINYKTIEEFLDKVSEIRKSESELNADGELNDLERNVLRERVQLLHN